MYKNLLLISIIFLLARITTYPQINTDGPNIFAPGVISTGDYETHPDFSPSGDTLFFLKCAPDFSTFTICISYLINGRWTHPIVAPFSGKYLDGDPFITKDGNSLYFVSNRPVKKGGPVKSDFDIWKVTKTQKGWGNPTHLSAPINSPFDEYYPTIADDGTMYFGSTRRGRTKDSDCDIYCSKPLNGKYTTVENLGDSINTSGDEFEPFISRDQKYLIFMAARPRGLKNADFYISFNKKGIWSKAIKLPEPINSSAVEFSPKITWDGKYFVFSSTRKIESSVPYQKENINALEKRINSAGNGLGDIYIMKASAFWKEVDSVEKSR